MATNKNYLMHYRTPGSKNGYTKYPGKYTPVGEKAKEDYVAPLGNTRNRINSMTSEDFSKLGKKSNNEYVAPLGNTRNRINSMTSEDFSKIRNSKDRTGHIDSTNVSSAWRNYNFRRNRYGNNAQNTGNNIVNTTRRRGPNSAFEAQQIQRTRANQRAAENRRIAGGNPYSSSSNKAATMTKNRKAAEARRISGGNPYVNQREENRKAAEQRLIAGGSGISSSQRQKAAEARRISGGNPYVNQREENRKNINDWYGNQVRRGNQSAAENRRIAGGSQGTITRAEAAVKNAESERKKKKLKNVLKALLKSRSRGISMF